MSLKSTEIGIPLAIHQGKESYPVRNFLPVVLCVLILAANSFGEPTVVRASAVPEPGVLVALGSGLIGLATMIRRRFN